MPGWSTRSFRLISSTPSNDSQVAASLVEVEFDAGRYGTDLAAGVEDPGVTDAIGPRAVGFEGRIMHVTCQHDVGSVLVDPPAELGIAVVLATCPTGRRADRRPVVHPHPRRRPASRVAGELSDDGVAPIGPSHHGHTVINVPPISSESPSVDAPVLRASSSHNAARSPFASSPVRSWLPELTTTRPADCSRAM